MQEQTADVYLIAVPAHSVRMLACNLGMCGLNLRKAVKRGTGKLRTQDEESEYIPKPALLSGKGLILPSQADPENQFHPEHYMGHQACKPPGHHPPPETFSTLLPLSCNTNVSTAISLVLLIWSLPLFGTMP